MRYKFKALRLWDELSPVIGDLPVSVKEDGEEIIFDLGDVELTAPQEKALKQIMETKPLLRSKMATFVEKGLDLKLTSEE